MQGRLNEGIEEVSINTIEECDWIEIDLGDPQVDAIPRVAIASATQAFKVCMRQFVINAAVKAYEPPMSLPKAVAHGLFYENGEFSIKQTVKTVGSAGLAGAASMFAFKPAKDAVIYLTRLFTGDTTSYFTGQEAVIALSQFGNVTRTIVLINFMSRNMFDKFINKTPEEIVYLTVEKPQAPGVVRLPKSVLGNVWEKTKFGSRKLFDLGNAVCANLPVLFNLIDTSPAMAFTSFFAFIPLSLFGMDHLKLRPESKYTARSVEVNYMREQLFTFLLLPRARQNEIIENINWIEESNQPDKDKVMFGMLLNLAKPEESVEERALIRILQDHPTEWYKKAVAGGMGGMSAFAQLPFAEISGVSIARLFADPSSSGAIAAGILAAILSLLPTVGLGFRGGEEAGRKLFVKHPSLGTIVNPELRDTLKWLVIGINLLAGGTSISFTYSASKDFASLMNLSAEASRIFKLSMISANYVNASSAFGQYFINAIDELVLFIAKHHSDEETQRLMSFINGYTKLISIMESINIENYCDLMANWKLAGHSEVSRTLHALFSEQLSDLQYAKFQQDLSEAYDLPHGLKDSHAVILGNRLVKDTYIVSPSFLDRHQGLRRRRPVRDVSGEIGDEIEMQFRTNL